MHKFLTGIRDSEDEYAIQEGIEVWVDLTRFHASTVTKCLMLCLISEDVTGDEKTRIWVLNEDGRKVLSDEKHIPGIVTALAEKAES